MSDREKLERAWGLASLPMASTHYTQAVLHFLCDDRGRVCSRSLLMFELAIEICGMARGSFEALLVAWPDRRRAPTSPIAPHALRVA